MHSVSRLFSCLLAMAFLLESQGTAWTQDEASFLNAQVTEAMQQSRQGNRASAAAGLAALAREAEKEGALEAWSWAQAAAVEAWLDGQRDEEQEYFDLNVAPQKLLHEVRHRCEAQGAAGPLSYIHHVLARWSIEQESQAAAAAQAWERAGSYALDANQVNQAVLYWIYAARIYRNEQQAAHVQECQSWLDLLAKERASDLSDESSRLLAGCRKKAEAMLAEAFPGPALPSEPELSLQPLGSSVKVSSTDNERGRARFTLANHQTKSVSGLLTLTATQGNVAEWQRDGDRLLISLRPTLKPQAAQHRLRLLPGERLKLYVEYLFPGGAAEITDQIQLDWTDGTSSKVATGKFTTSAGLANVAQITNVSQADQARSWPVPFYHDIYYRGNRSSVENILAQVSADARVEIYNEDNGELLAIDAEGDGIYDGANDFLERANDRDADGRPDLVVTPSNPVGSLEIYVFPKNPAAGNTKLSVQLVDDTEARWRVDAVDEQHAK
jgi:hypothetical protein